MMTSTVLKRKQTLTFLVFSPMGTFIRSLLFSFLFTGAFHGVEILDLQTTATGFKIKTREDYEIFYADGTGKWKTFKSLYTNTTTKFGLKEYSLKIHNNG